MSAESAEAREERRLAALKRYDILDTPAEEDFDDLVKLASQICDVPIALISLVDKDRLWFKSKVGVDGTQMPRKNAFCSYAVDGGKALVVPNAHADPRFANHPVVAGPSNFSFYAGVCLVAPGGEKIGTLCVLDTKPRELSQEQLKALEALSRQVTGQMELRRTVSQLWSEMDLARKIQTVLLPTRPTVAGFEVSAFMRPASNVGGDYYDFLQGDGKDWVFIGDVSGHGVTSGLIMMMAQSAVRATLESLPQEGSISPARVLSKVNASIRSNLKTIGQDQYMTITGLRVDGSTLCHAGQHQDILVYRAKKDQVEVIETSGVWLGVMDDISGLLSDRTFQVEPDDVVLLYTDGLTEAKREGGLVGDVHLRQVFKEAARGKVPTEKILEALFEKLKVKTFDDDVTVIIMRHVGQ